MNNYPSHPFYNHIDAYKSPNDTSQGEWLPCPKCNLTPHVWSFDNGRSTACGCWNSEYDHFSIHAESICSVHRRTGGKKMMEYDSDALRVNWNHYCTTGEILFEHAGKRDDDRW